MPILVECPNGHLLKMKRKYAGMSGYCPKCEGKVPITVPPLDDQDAAEASQMSAALSMEPASRSLESPRAESLPASTARADEHAGEDSLSVLDADLKKQQRRRDRKKRKSR